MTPQRRRADGSLGGRAGRMALVAAAALGACGGPKTPTPPVSIAPDAGAPSSDQPDGGAAIDLDDMRIAAVEKALNDTVLAVQACWGKAAASDYRVAGRADTMVTFAAPGTPPTVATGGTAVFTDPAFAACLVGVYAGYAWPPIFEPGQAVELPLIFQSVDGQNLIHEADVAPVALAGGASARVLLDAANTGNPAASMIAYDVPAGAELPLARASRDELWLVLGEGELTGPGKGASTVLHDGDGVYLPAGAARRLRAAKTAGLRVVTVAIPGAVETAMRRGTAPWTPLDARDAGRTPARKAAKPIVFARAAAPTFASAIGRHTILIDPETHKAAATSLGVLMAQAQGEVPAHRHDTSTELLYVVSGSGAMTVGGIEMLVSAGDAIQIPAGVEHAMRVGAGELTAIQIYTPGGPEQRFKAAPAPP